MQEELLLWKAGLPSKGVSGGDGGISAREQKPSALGSGRELDVGTNCRDLKLQLNVTVMRSGNRRLFLYGANDMCKPSYLC